MRVAIVGGTGAFGSALARRLAEAEIEVTIGSRDANRAAATAADVGAARGLENADAVQGADLVILSADASAAFPTVLTLADALGELPILSVASELRILGGIALPGPDPLSLAERLQQVHRGPVVAGLHSLAARSLEAGKAEGDALVCGDDEAAKAAALELAEKLVTGRALDAGPLASARALEGMTAVIVNLNRRYRGHAGLRIEGL
ncbi:MAG TPA: NAD(P)-binding domain-containing protein [Gaiellaceae bacterium]